MRAHPLLLVTLLGAPALSAQSALLVDIRNLDAQEYREAAFVLDAPQTVQLEAVGAEPRNDTQDTWRGRDDERDVWPAAAWIIDARTRAVVWDLRTAANNAPLTRRRSVQRDILLQVFPTQGTSP